jgi:synaptic vesicle membrane protein VAT-1
LQLARIHEATAVGVVGGSHKVQVARDLGAAVVIDKSAEPLWPAAERAAPNGYDIVLDANGIETLGQSFAHLASPGRLVVYGFHSMFHKGGAAKTNRWARLWGAGRPDYAKLAADWLRTPRFNPLALTNLNRSVMAFNLSYMFDNQVFLAEAMAQLFAWIEAGKIQKPEVKCFPFEHVAEAHRALESGTTTGKLVLSVT